MSGKLHWGRAYVLINDWSWSMIVLRDKRGWQIEPNIQIRRGIFRVWLHAHQNKNLGRPRKPRSVGRDRGLKIALSRSVQLYCCMDLWGTSFCLYFDPKDLGKWFGLVSPLHWIPHAKPNILWNNARTNMHLLYCASLLIFPTTVLRPEFYHTKIIVAASHFLPCSLIY